MQEFGSNDEENADDSSSQSSFTHGNLKIEWLYFRAESYSEQLNDK